MKWQLRFGNGKRVLSVMLMCCLWVCAVPAAAKAQAKISSATCTVKNIQTPMMDQWKIYGAAQVTGLVPQNASTTASFRFQTSNDGGKTWSYMNAKESDTTTGVGGTANFTTQLYTIGQPAKGQQYRVIVSATYIDGTGKQVAIGILNSDPVTPSP